MSAEPMRILAVRLEDVAKVLEEIRANVEAIKADVATMRPPTIVRIQNADE